MATFPSVLQLTGSPHIGGAGPDPLDNPITRASRAAQPGASAEEQERAANDLEAATPSLSPMAQPHAANLVRALRTNMAKLPRAKTPQDREIRQILGGPQALTTPSRTVELETTPGAIHKTTGEGGELAPRSLESFQLPAGTLGPGEREAGRIITSSGDFAKALIEFASPAFDAATKQITPKKLTSMEVRRLQELDMSVTQINQIIEMREVERGVKVSEPKGTPSFERSLAQEVAERGLTGQTKVDFESERRTTEGIRKTQATIKGKEIARLDAVLGERASNFINPDDLTSADPKSTERKALAAGFRSFRGKSGSKFLVFTNKALDILDKFEALVPKLFPKGGGMVQRAKNAANLEIRRLSGDPDAVEFFALLDSNLAGFAVAGGDAANIAVREQEFQKKSLPNLFDLRGTALRKIQSKRSILRGVIDGALGIKKAKRGTLNLSLPAGGVELP